MTVAEGGDVQLRYARISDRLKSVWTAHQFVSGVFRLYLLEEVPYELYAGGMVDLARSVGARLAAEMRSGKGPPSPAVMVALDAVESELEDAARRVIAAESRIGPSLLRRFFDQLERRDDAIIESLLRFHLAAGDLEGPRRDKIDFLFTRLGEDFLPLRGEFVVRETLELRQRLIGIVSMLRLPEPPREEVVRVIRAIHSLRDEILASHDFDELSERNLLRDARTFKHRVGDLYFQPDVLLAIVELNVTARNRFARLYEKEEQRLIGDADKLMEYGEAIERNFGGTNPLLVSEIARFRLLREKFDTLRAESNIKHDVVAGLKASMNSILTQLDRGLESEEETIELPPAFYDRTRILELLAQRFGRDEPLLDYLLQVGEGIDLADPHASVADIGQLPGVRGLRLEPWEAVAWQKVFGERPAEDDADTEELWVIYLRAAALRIKIDAEASILATTVSAEVKPDGELLAKARRSLDLAKELDQQFGDLLQEAACYPSRVFFHQLYRSRLRLLRGFTGLWLLYDGMSGESPHGAR